MPDPLQILEALVAAGAVAALMLLVCDQPWRPPGRLRSAWGGVLGTAAGFYVGGYWLGLVPRWPPREDQDRLLLVVFPAIIIVEWAAAWTRSRAWIAWLLRFVVAAGTAPVLLYNTSYLADLAGAGTREWSPLEAGLILIGLAAVLFGVWISLVAVVKRSPGRSVPLAAALASAAAGVTIMLSGYATGGQFGLTLAAALCGTLAATLFRRAPETIGMLSLGIVGLFAVLAMGRFFGNLTTGNAALLFLGLLCCWIPELPFVRPASPRLRGCVRILLATIPMAAAVFIAQHQFQVDSAQHSPAAAEPSLEDYMNFSPPKR